MLDSGVRPRLGSANALARPERSDSGVKASIQGCAASRDNPKDDLSSRSRCATIETVRLRRAARGVLRSRSADESPEMHCFACQSKMDAGDRWCAKCGAAAQQSMDPDSERKFVTILRADLVQSTDLIAELEPEQAVSRLEPALTAMRAAVRQFGGIVSKELGDGLTAVFGAPMADDNHAPMACHAAIELVRRVTAWAIPVSRSGSASTPASSSPMWSPASFPGSTKSAARRSIWRPDWRGPRNPGQIFASEACQKLAEGHVQFEFLGRKPLRGFPEPVPVYSGDRRGRPDKLAGTQDAQRLPIRQSHRRDGAIATAASRKPAPAAKPSA